MSSRSGSSSSIIERRERSNTGLTVEASNQRVDRCSFRATMTSTPVLRTDVASTGQVETTCARSTTRRVDLYRLRLVLRRPTTELQITTPQLQITA